MTRWDQEPWAPDWTHVPDAAIAPLLAEAREQLQGVIEMGVSSDQRSVALGGAFAAGAFALFTVSATVFSGSHQNLAMQWASAVTGLLFMIGSGFCLLAAFPDDFFVGGYAPRDLFTYTSQPLWMQIAAIEDFQRRIDANRAGLARDGRLIQCAIGFAFAGIGVGTVIFLSGIILGTRGFSSAFQPMSAMMFVALMTVGLLTALRIDDSRNRSRSASRPS